MIHEKVLIYDFGSQYTQLIARRIRELNVYCEILPFSSIPSNHSFFTENPKLKGIILSGSPCSVNDQNAPMPNLNTIMDKLPVLGICYGAQLLAKQFGGNVSPSSKREYGRAMFKLNTINENIFENVPPITSAWMSHGDTITQLPEGAYCIGSSDNIEYAAFRFSYKEIYGLQFHPEVTHSESGKKILENFVLNICKCKGDFTPASFIDETVEKIKESVGDEHVILGLSGGVDSSVAAMLIHKAIGKNLTCIFVDNGLLRKDEFNSVLHSYRNLGLNIKGIDASKKFYEALHLISDPEQKRKAIGKTFIEVFDEEASKVDNAKWLAQGTIYPDVIESVSVNGPSVTIKSHHNVGGLPQKMNLKILEPLRLLFKDEVRRVGIQMNMPAELIKRHPFPGPGLGIRILGDIDEHKIKLLQHADSIYINLLKEFDLYDKIWQAGAILLPVKSVGVMGDERTYEFTVALRAVTSVDGMTADWFPLPYDFMAKVSNEIINNVKGINRVVYDISSKPPATIEWE